MAGRREVRYRLGEFRTIEAQPLDPESLRRLEEFVDRLLPGRERGAGREWLGRLGAPADVPDLLQELPAGHGDSGWVASIHETLLELRERIHIQLLACEYVPSPHGFLCIAATSASVNGEVCLGDVVRAGFVALRARGTVRVAPRVFRVIGGSGTLDVIEEETLGSDRVAETVRDSFEAARFSRVVQALSETTIARGVPFDELLEALADRYGEPGDSGVSWMRDAVDALDALEHPRLWDQINALNEVARDLEDWRDRLELEAVAGSLARLQHPPLRRRAPALALTEV